MIIRRFGRIKSLTVIQDYAAASKPFSCLSTLQFSSFCASALAIMPKPRMENFPISQGSINDLIYDEKSSWSKPIRAILSVTAVPVHLPVIKSYYEVRKPHDHNSACFTGLFIVRSLWTFR